MTTRGQLKTAIARDLGDPSNLTFSDAHLGDFIDDATAAVGRIAPLKFDEQITPLLNTLDYDLQTAIFGGPEPTVQVQRVEVWDGSVSPRNFLYWLTPQAQGYVNASGVGWEVRGGTLSITNAQYIWLNLATQVLRVWGYRPYPRLTDDATTLGFPFEIEMAVRAYAKVAAYRLLDTDRSLFTQWQIRANNTDMTPASLMNLVSAAEASWLRLAKQITVIRTGQ